MKFIIFLYLFIFVFLFFPRLSMGEIPLSSSTTCFDTIPLPGSSEVPESHPSGGNDIYCDTTPLVKSRQRRNGLKRLKRLSRMISRLKKFLRKRQANRLSGKKTAHLDDKIDNEITQLSIETGWSSVEFAGINLGDKRLNRRLVSISDAFGAQPSAPIPQACGDWKSTKAAYRLFDNVKTTAAKILLPHQKQTQKRMKNYTIVLAIQDSSYLNYTHHPKTKNLGPIGTKKQNIKGMVMHTTLAVTTDKLPLGVLTHSIWVREAREEKESKDLKSLPIEEKESYKWIEALRETTKLTPDGVEVVTVCDAEGDIYELFAEGKRLKGKLLVRAAQERNLDEGEDKLWSFMSKRPVKGRLKIHLPARDDKKERDAIVEVRFSRVKLRQPVHKKGAVKSLSLWAVLVKEVNPPEDVKEPVEWKLLTNVPVKTFEDAVERTEWYSCRWQIEVYHKVLKSGCKVEKCCLETAERLMNYIALKSVIAWRLFWMVHMNRTNPDAPATTVLADHEWKALYSTVHKTSEIPDEPPTVREAIHWIAQLGGWLGRKSDKEPGITAIWRGWQRLQDKAEMWLILNNSKPSRNS
jgi:hypothetical protein